MKIPLLLALLLACCVAAGADPELRARYGPYPDSGFPQIIQADDYATIESIESLCRSLAGISPAKEAPEEFGRAVDFEITGDALVFRSRHDPKHSVVVRHQDSDATTIHEMRFAGRPTTLYYSSLFKILSDHTKNGKCREMRFVQYGTKAYKRRSLIEFDFGAQIVVIDSLSNGPKEEERLYILDVVQRKDSMFWSRERA